MNKLFSYFSNESEECRINISQTNVIVNQNEDKKNDDGEDAFYKNDEPASEKKETTQNDICDGIDTYFYVTPPQGPSVYKNLVYDCDFECESEKDLSDSFIHVNNFMEKINNSNFNIDSENHQECKSNSEYVIKSNEEPIYNKSNEVCSDTKCTLDYDKYTLEYDIENNSVKSGPLSEASLENSFTNNISITDPSNSANSFLFASVKIPIIFVQDIINSQNIIKDYLQDLSICDSRIIFADVNPLGSVYDRAIQLFHEIKGEICYFGKNCLRQISDIDKTSSMYGKFPQWSEICPVHFICLGYGGNTVRELLYLLKSKKIPKFDNTENYGRESFYETSEKWISSIVTIASPLCGVDTSKDDWNYYLTKNLIHNSMAIKYVGWSIILSRKSNSLQEYLSTKKLQYWNLPTKHCIFLSENQLQYCLNNNTCFTDLSINNCKYTYHNIYKSIFSDCKVPVLKIVVNDNKCNLSSIEQGSFNTFFSQRFFYGENINEKKIDDVKQFNKYEFEDAYILLDECITNYDVLDSPIFDEHYLRKSYIIHKIINDIYILLSN